VARFLGVDGCRSGWFAAWHEGGRTYGEIYASAENILEAHPDVEKVMVDIPIGLKADTPRELESAVRRQLGPRKSSVFPVPCYDAAYAPDYEAASAINRQRIGKGLSKQAWFICPRICDVDRLLRSNEVTRNILGECHPELAFAYLHGAPLSSSKKNEVGQSQRRGVLQPYIPDLTEFIDGMLARFPRRDLQLDDCLDALALVITAMKPSLLATAVETGVGDIQIRMWVPDC
jgi:predicted RNase H-like nuclease